MFMMALLQYKFYITLVCWFEVVLLYSNNKSMNNIYCFNNYLNNIQQKNILFFFECLKEK